MTDKDGFVRAYYRCKTTADLMIGLYHPEGGAKGEFCVSWGPQGPYLRVYSDAWALLPDFQDVLDNLRDFGADRIEPHRERLVDALEWCGIVDLESVRRDG